MKLYVYDGSEINRGREYVRSLSKNPVDFGFERGLKLIDPPLPFLVRTIFGDYEVNWDGSEPEAIIKPTFGGRKLEDLLLNVLENGSDRFNATEETDTRDYIWADSHHSFEWARPYRMFDDSGCSAHGFINDFSMLIDKRFYRSKKDNIYFYQPNIKKKEEKLCEE